MSFSQALQAYQVFVSSLFPLSYCHMTMLTFKDLTWLLQCKSLANIYLKIIIRIVPALTSLLKLWVTSYPSELNFFASAIINLDASELKKGLPTRSGIIPNTRNPFPDLQDFTSELTFYFIFTETYSFRDNWQQTWSIQRQ